MADLIIRIKDTKKEEIKDQYCHSILFKAFTQKDWDYIDVFKYDLRDIFGQNKKIEIYEEDDKINERPKWLDENAKDNKKD